MFRGGRAWTGMALIAAFLLAIPFLTGASPFAHAHTARHAQAKAQPGMHPLGLALRDIKVTSRDCDRSGGPASPLHTRDRSRATLTADSAPSEPERVQKAQDPAGAHPAGLPGADRHRPSRSSASHSPAALQVFRC
ncbi:hypothetical protein [Streptomyces acidiscabies]|uniref:Uncharacterized protein n=1 Tax=Streptomyces acidiscabies TaxID=42234 RepID=A0AAP6EFH4_9ACTN|nr:hypothetical protein [Streptomyces acidiscabies]MBZ3915839.1 hypothetical protein [Streptomyces acidiscabies]MDX2960246.1 hypothetical protein [Streptomyces acidiscabies]MDX3019597.1 hypothetical protein [Streptomyces acidiscabies]MDX3793302.1 hypothetical protein [Streptomyces acidiscabies]GAV39352.1 hypothetical protein Saa2_02237 [Streptomyces acidiscabies]